MGETLLKLVVVGFGIWFLVGHVSDALTRGCARLRGTREFTVAQPWRFSIALGLNIAFGLLLFTVPFFADAVVRVVPDWIMHRATTAGLPWLAVMVTVTVYVVAATRLLVFMATRK
jgi:hypothetical protein